jgi:hypothetical protein
MPRAYAKEERLSMNGRYSDVALLLSQIRKSESVLKRITDEYDTFLRTDFKMLGKKNTSAIVIAEYLVDYYTCLESLFFRISQFFENNLSKEKWHADLLERMTLQVEGLREPVVSDHTQAILSELMKFRHFRRYYFELNYDWDKLAYLQKKLGEVRDLIPTELDTFKAFVCELQEEI